MAALNILGLHFGHDAGVSVVRDGRIAACVVRERHHRAKHAISLEVKNIEAAVEAAGLRFDQIDYCAITSTQAMELIIDDPARFSLSFDRHPGHSAPCSLDAFLKKHNIRPAERQIESLLNVFCDPALHDSYFYRHYVKSFPEHRGRPRSDFSAFGWIDAYYYSESWSAATLEQIGAADFSPFLQTNVARHGFHYPVTVKLDGRAAPGYFIAHHMAHAASSYYQSPFTDAAILTNDGFGQDNWSSDLSGMYAWGIGGKIYPFTPHHLSIGAFYEGVGYSLGLGDFGASGKLMGLAGYGRPRFFDRRFVGNWHDWKRCNFNVNRWRKHCIDLGRKMGYQTAPLGQAAQMTAPINIDIAASTQKLLEETYLAAADALYKALSKSGQKTTNLCLSGGTALNCPSNSRVWREGPFPNVFIEPGCDDSGLAIGAALYLCHNVLDQPRPARAPEAIATPYRGVEITSDAIAAALEAAKNEIDFERCDDAAATAARDLAENRIIGWFEGRSEIGPRALGHRSILADARHADNWPRVNRLKGREPWRPFAPAVLESEAQKWFRGAPQPSPYMLFTASVLSNQLPAITHADGTARIQTVSPANGEFFRVIERFFARTGVPVVLNTSFNGPGEPIVETPEHAIAFLIRSELDALYIGGRRVVRRSLAPAKQGTGSQ